MCLLQQLTKFRYMLSTFLGAECCWLFLWLLTWMLAIFRGSNKMICLRLGQQYMPISHMHSFTEWHSCSRV